MELRTYLNTLSPPDQAAFARRCGTTVGYLRKALSVGQKLREALCINIDRESSGVVRCKDLRPDVDWAYLRASQVVAEPHKDEALPVRALACATQSVRLTADRRDAERRELARRAEPVDAPHPGQLPLAIEAGESHQEAA